jgi:hypothetical protein
MVGKPASAFRGKFARMGVMGRASGGFERRIEIEGYAQISN